jgi:hypothetical protein
VPMDNPVQSGRGTLVLKGARARTFTGAIHTAPGWVHFRARERVPVATGEKVLEISRTWPSSALYEIHWAHTPNEGQP